MHGKHATILSLFCHSFTNPESVSRVGVIHPPVIYCMIDPYFGSAWGFIRLIEIENEFLR